jgi:hypothetical protein
VHYQKNSYYKTAKQGKNDSKFEASKARELELLQKAKEIVGFQEQVKIPLVVNGYHLCNYFIDFVIEHTDGTLEYLETKGFATDVWKLKWKLFEALYDKPGNKLTVEYQGKSWKPQRRRVK